MKSDHDLPAFLKKRVLLFQGIDAALIARVAAAASTSSYAPGAFLCRAGEPARHVWVLLEGLVCVNRCTWKGGRVNIEIMVPGDAFGLPALSHWAYPSDIQAPRPSLVAAIPRRALLDEMTRQPKLAQRVVSIVAQRLDFVESQLFLAREPVERRLAAALLYLSRKFGPSVPMTSAEIGEMAQTTPETAMRKLKILERAGILRRRRGCVEIADARALEARTRETA